MSEKMGNVHPTRVSKQPVFEFAIQDNKQSRYIQYNYLNITQHVGSNKKPEIKKILTHKHNKKDLMSKYLK